MIRLALQTVFLILSQDIYAAGLTPPSECRIEDSDVQEGCKFKLIPDNGFSGPCEDDDIEWVDVLIGCKFLFVLNDEDCNIEDVDVVQGCKFLFLRNEEDTDCNIEDVDVVQGCKFLFYLNKEGCNVQTTPSEPCHIKMLPTKSSMCAPPIRIDDFTLVAPKTQCNGGKSAISVFGQNCTVNGGISSCMMGGNGFSFCDVEFLFYRDGRWVDWDLCSLCTVHDKDRPLTSRGYRCEGECTNIWNNGEMDAPRCKVKDRNISKDPEYDYCTTCRGGGCAQNVQVDDRPGKDVKRLGIGMFGK